MDHNMIDRNENFVVIKKKEFIIKEIKHFWMAGTIVIFFLNDKKSSSHMDHIRRIIIPRITKFIPLIKQEMFLKLRW